MKPQKLAAKINDRTTLPLVWVFALIGALASVGMIAAGILIWGTRLEARAMVHDSEITELKVKQDTYHEDVVQLKTGLVRIETILNDIKEK